MQAGGGLSTSDCTHPHTLTIIPRGSEVEVLTGHMPFLLSNKQHQSTEGRIRAKLLKCLWRKLVIDPWQAKQSYCLILCVNIFC